MRRVPSGFWQHWLTFLLLFLTGCSYTRGSLEIQQLIDDSYELLNEDNVVDMQFSSQRVNIGNLPNVVHLTSTSFGSCIHSGQSVDLATAFIQSNSGIYVGYFSVPDSAFIIYKPSDSNRQTWNIPMTGIATTLEVVSGNLAWRDTSDVILYQSSTSSGQYAILQNDGRFALYASATSGTATWSCNINSYCAVASSVETQAQLRTCSNFPSTSPTAQPSNPSATPSAAPSTVQPTFEPSLAPSVHPTGPSQSPTLQPSTAAPTQSPAPSVCPSVSPSTHPTGPSYSPSFTPVSALPTLYPTSSPLFPSHPPTKVPSLVPSLVPSTTPSLSPSLAPSTIPSMFPSHNPSFSPSGAPSDDPTLNPSPLPTFTPSVQPSQEPTQPTEYPTNPTFAPTATPSFLPTTMDDVGNCLFYGKSLSSGGQQLTSRSGQFRLSFTNTGGLIVYYKNNSDSDVEIITWNFLLSDSTGGVNTAPWNLLVTKLGNLKVQNSDFRTIFETETDGSKNYAILQDDGDFVVYTDDVNFLWSCSSATSVASLSLRCITSSSRSVVYDDDEEDDDGDVLISSCNNNDRRYSGSSATSPQADAMVVYIAVGAAAFFVAFIVGLWRYYVKRRHGRLSPVLSYTDVSNCYERSASNEPTSLEIETGTNDGGFGSGGLSSAFAVATTVPPTLASAQFFEQFVDIVDKPQQQSRRVGAPNVSFVIPGIAGRSSSALAGSGASPDNGNNSNLPVATSVQQQQLEQQQQNRSGSGRGRMAAAQGEVVPMAMPEALVVGTVSDIDE